MGGVINIVTRSGNGLDQWTPEIKLEVMDPGRFQSHMIEDMERLV